MPDDFLDCAFPTYFRNYMKCLFSVVSFPLILIRRRIATMSSDSNIAKGLSSTITLNDGVVMPLFGFGTYALTSAKGADPETITSLALQNGYRMVDTAAFYQSVYCCLPNVM